MMGWDKFKIYLCNEGKLGVKRQIRPFGRGCCCLVCLEGSRMIKVMVAGFFPIGGRCYSGQWMQVMRRKLFRKATRKWLLNLCSEDLNWSANAGMG